MPKPSATGTSSVRPRRGQCNVGCGFLVALLHPETQTHRPEEEQSEDGRLRDRSSSGRAVSVDENSEGHHPDDRESEDSGDLRRADRVTSR